jgi:hypothetical protein
VQGRRSILVVADLIHKFTSEFQNELKTFRASVTCCKVKQAERPSLLQISFSQYVLIQRINALEQVYVVIPHDFVQA